MTWDGILAELDQAIGQAALEDLPALLGRLVEAEERARLRLRLPMPSSNGNGRPEEERERWLSAEQAIAAAALPNGTEQERERSLKRLYAWAKGKPWASNPTGRYLRINERRFRAWLTTRA